MEDYPPGCRFAPTDQELITLFLENKAMGMQISDVYPIIDRPLYGKHATPWDVLTEDDPWQDSILPNKKTIYVFSRLIFMNGNANRAVRTAGCGTWGGKSVPQEIKNSRGQVIGKKKSFTFKSHEGSEEEMNARGRWIMHEYSLVAARGNRNVEADGYVICRISKDFRKVQSFDKEKSQITTLSMDSIVCSNTNTATSRKRKSSSVNYGRDTRQQKKACDIIEEQANQEYMSYVRMLTEESDDQRQKRACSNSIQEHVKQENMSYMLMLTQESYDQQQNKACNCVQEQVNQGNVSYVRMLTQESDDQQQNKACSNCMQEQENQENKSYVRMLNQENDDQELFKDVCLDEWRLFDI